MGIYEFMLYLPLLHSRSQGTWRSSEPRRRTRRTRSGGRRRSRERSTSATERGRGRRRRRRRRRRNGTRSTDSTGTRRMTPGTRRRTPEPGRRGGTRISTRTSLGLTQGTRRRRSSWTTTGGGGTRISSLGRRGRGRGMSWTCRLSGMVCDRIRF